MNGSFEQEEWEGRTHASIQVKKDTEQKSIALLQAYSCNSIYTTQKLVKRRGTHLWIRRRWQNIYSTAFNCMKRCIQFVCKVKVFLICAFFIQKPIIFQYSNTINVLFWPLIVWEMVLRSWEHLNRWLVFKGYTWLCCSSQVNPTTRRWSAEAFAKYAHTHSLTYTLAS